MVSKSIPILVITGIVFSWVLEEPEAKGRGGGGGGGRGRGGGTHARGGGGDGGQTRPYIEGYDQSYDDEQLKVLKSRHDNAKLETRLNETYREATTRKNMVELCGTM